MSEQNSKRDAPAETDDTDQAEAPAERSEAAETTASEAAGSAEAEKAEKTAEIAEPEAAEPEAAGPETAERPQAEPAPPLPDSRRARRLLREVRSFLRAHGGSGDAHLQHLGRGVTRIVLIGADGQWGDLVAPERQQAQQALDASRVPVWEALEGEPAGRMRNGPYEWTRMAGIQLGGPENPATGEPVSE